MKSVLFYHVYMTEVASYWIDIVEEQLKSMERGGMLNALSALKVNAISRDPLEVEILDSMFRSYGIKCAKITSIQNTFRTDYDMINNINQIPVSEGKTLSDIKEFCKTLPENVAIGYIHTKGITAFKFLPPYGCNFEKYKVYKSWRHLLNKCVLEEWKDAHNHINNMGYDTSGAYLTKEPTLHYSGNFWWAQSNFINKLPDPADNTWWHDLKSKTSDHWLKHCPDRFKDEMWLCSSNGGEHIQTLNVGVQSPSTVYIPSDFLENL